MARPKKFSFELEDGRVVSCKFVKMPDTGDPSEIICSFCVPQRTEMLAVGDVIQYGIEPKYDTHWTVFRCQKCDRHSVVKYSMDDKRGVNG